MKTLHKAKTDLIIKHPFFASILFSMPIIEDTNVKTLATNGEEVRYNPEFIKTLSMSETVFVLAHEVMHCVFHHMTRRGTRNPNRWNIAADYIINDVLSQDKVGTMPQGCLYNPQLVQQGNGVTEQVYALLPEETENKSGDGSEHGQGGSLDQCLDAGKDEAEQSQKEAEMKPRIIQAANAAKMQGKLSAGLSRLVSEMVKPRVDWREVLRRFISEKAKVDLSFARPKRRWLAEDIYLPSKTGERMGNLVVAVDCSGSINEKVLNAFAAEIRAIVQDTLPAETHVVYFDSQVVNHEVFTGEDTVKLTPCGGGGTAFSPVFKYVESKDINPVACVFLTDLCCDDFGDSPDYPVLWVSTHDGDAPFGEILRIKGE